MTVSDLSPTEYANTYIKNALKNLDVADHTEVVKQLSFLELRKELPPELGNVKDTVFALYSHNITGPAAMLDKASAIKSQGLKFLSGNVDLLTNDMCNFMSSLLDFNNIEDMLRSLLTFNCAKLNTPTLTNLMSSVIASQNAFSKLTQLQGAGQDVFSTITRLQNGDFTSSDISATCGLIMKIINNLEDSLKDMLAGVMDLFSNGSLDIAQAMKVFSDKLKQIVSNFLGNCIGKSDQTLGINSSYAKGYRDMVTAEENASPSGVNTSTGSSTAESIFEEIYNTKPTFIPKPTTTLEDLADELKRKGL